MPSDLLRVLTTLWLIALAVIDVRQRELPHLLTTGPLLVIGGAFAIRALAPIGGVSVPNQSWDDVAVLLVFGAVLLSDTGLAALPALTAIGIGLRIGHECGAGDRDRLAAGAGRHVRPVSWARATRR